tara:strand:+ start:88 stop:294 length:207 start_codon:yes stop_codon:yes gene_type:complete
MAEYWYKKDKRILRISEDTSDKSVVQKRKHLKSVGYVQIKDRHDVTSIIKPKTVSKPKKKKSTKSKKK